MGSFLGHVVPGTFFSLFSLWWLLSIFRRYYMCKRAAGEGGGGGGRIFYRNTSTFFTPCCPKLPFEGMLKVVAVVIGMTGEFATAWKNGVFVHLNNAQHMTMFFFFGLNGAMDILGHYGAPLPKDLDYVSAILAFLIEGFLFLYHLHGRTPMDVQVHMYLVYVVAGCVVATGLEMYHRRSVLPALARVYFTLLQGTWFFQVGFILYPPVGQKWTEDDHSQMMIVTLIFCWHCAVVFVLMLVAGFLIHTRVKALSSATVYHSLHPLTRLSSANGSCLSKMDTEQVRHIIADSEEEDV
nr:transmembrane protein 45B-like [Procambarus clarkii]